jgi:F420-dependent oxidoreductase-like protein
VATKRVRFGLKVAQMYGSYAQMRDAWLEADRLGFDTAWGHDHMLNQNEIHLPEDEGWTALAALLALSKQIRGGLMVTANTFRHPSLLAKMATTCDHISNGRVQVGLGAGWLEEEHREYGLDFPPVGERMRRLAEACQILKALWTEPRATFEGRYYQVREAYHEPKPIQKPHPPIVIGVSGEQVGLKIVARYADEWNLSGGSPEDFRRKSAIIDGYCREIGRDPAEIERSVQFQPEAMQGDFVTKAGSYIEAGATHLILTCPVPYSAEGVRSLWYDVVQKLR